MARISDQMMRDATKKFTGLPDIAYDMLRDAAENFYISARYYSEHSDDYMAEDSRLFGKMYEALARVVRHAGDIDALDAYVTTVDNLTNHRRTSYSMSNQEEEKG